MGIKNGIRTREAFDAHRAFLTSLRELAFRNVVASSLEVSNTFFDTQLVSLTRLSSQPEWRDFEHAEEGRFLTESQLADSFFKATSGFLSEPDLQEWIRTAFETRTFRQIRPVLIMTVQAIAVDVRLNLSPPPAKVHASWINTIHNRIQKEHSSNKSSNLLIAIDIDYSSDTSHTMASEELKQQWLTAIFEEL